MLHRAEIPWNVLVLWVFLLRLQEPDLDVCGVHDLWPGEHFRVHFDRNEILFDISGSDRRQRLCLRSGLLEFTMMLAAKYGFDYHPPWSRKRSETRSNSGRHLQLVRVARPAASFTQPPPTEPFPVPWQRQAMDDGLHSDEVG